MKKIFTSILTLLCGCALMQGASMQLADDEVAETRRPVDSRHPMWLVHVDVWNKADPQKIIDLIPEQIRPYVVLNLSLSCQYDTEKNVYKMPQNAVNTYRSWGTVCQHNGMWFTCQPASGGHTHLQDDDIETFEYFYKQFPNFLGWNFAEQFWGFDEPGDKSSSSQADRLALFAKLVPMAHKYGGFLTISFCGNIWSHALNPLGMMKRNADLLAACKAYPDAILWLYKYTTSSCFYNNESVTYGPFIAGLAQNYGVRYDNCGWNGALDDILGKNHGKKYPNAAGFGTVIEQTCVNGGAVWDGPELIWTEDFENLSNTTVDGYSRRRWGLFNGFRNGWLDIWDKIIDGTLYIPTREEVMEKTKVVIVNSNTTGDDESKYAAWGDLYDGLYKQEDPFNKGNGQWMNNYCYFKKTGRYPAIPIVNVLYDQLAKNIPVRVSKASYSSRWGSQAAKVADFNKQYPEVSKGDLYVNRYRNQLVTYFPFTYLNKKKTASAEIPLLYNTCDSLYLNYNLLSSGVVHEYADHIDLYLNNYRADTTTQREDIITVIGATSEPTYTLKRRAQALMSATASWDAETKRYVLKVKHLGGVDVRINCVGVATERATDSVPNVALELPKQPAAYHGPITIEAEDMDFKNINSCVTDPYGWYPNVRGHAGNGFMDMGNNTSGSLKHKLTLAQGGDYTIQMRYMNTAKVSTITFIINGTQKVLKCDKTGTNIWKTIQFTAALKTGVNTLLINNTQGIAMYIDNVTYKPAEMEDEKFSVNIRPVEHGVVEASLDKATEGDTVFLNVTPDAGYELVGWNIIHGNITIKKNSYFIMPDDNVTLSPIYRDMTVVYDLDYSNVLSGTIPAGWRCTQENNDVHEYPNNYSTGARTMAGFVGYQNKGIYWREKSCEYGRQSAYRLALQPGKYRLSFVMAAWKQTPQYKVQVLPLSGGSALATATNLLAAPNANGNGSANLSAAVERELTFTVTSAGDYVISFTNLDVIGGYDEFLLLECRINQVIEPSDLDIIDSEEQDDIQMITTADGVSHDGLQHGLNIIQYKSGKTRKVWLK
ncbi:MAG: glycosyl hydrolase family 98 [Bacteroidales bacterium]|nr:glycosyl hydrolase family 98 [Bacteroidales bacterium]